ncbi:MAG: site-specific integrase [Streptosporangiaceae bacterium]
MVALPALVSGLDAELVRLGYKDSTMVWYRGCWRRMERFFAAQGVEEFSLDVAMAWVDEACGFFGKEQAGTLKRTDVYLFRVAQMLGEYEAHGAVLRRYNRSVSKLDAPGAEAVARFQAHLRAADRSVSTVRTYGTITGEFVAFTSARGGLACCDPATIAAFVATLAGYQAKTVEQKLCALRSFLRFASAEGLVDAACLMAVPAARPARQARIPSVWDPGEVARIIEAIDRDNPCGKRDYAIILLITMLGLRGVDVRRLEFADFDWAGNRLLVRQAKTGRRVQLPLLKEAGWAVIDYIRHGRPDCDCPQVFVRHTAPIGPFSDQDHLHQILVRHARVAHVAVSDKRRHGMHSLRHTLATRLMENGTPVEQIADILGHQSVQSTGVYLKSSLGLLSKCALDPDAPGREVSW